MQMSGVRRNVKEPYFWHSSNYPSQITELCCLDGKFSHIQIDEKTLQFECSLAKEMISAKERYHTYLDCASQFISSKCAKPKGFKLFFAHFKVFDFDRLAFAADNSLQTALALAKRLFKILTIFNGHNNASRLYFATKTAQQVLDWLFVVFSCY